LTNPLQSEIFYSVSVVAVGEVGRSCALPQFLWPPASEFSGSAPDKANKEKVTAGEKWSDKTK